MQQRELVRTLDYLAERGVSVFSLKMLRSYFLSDTTASLKQSLKRAETQGLIERPCRGIYTYSRGFSSNPAKLESIAAVLRAGKYSYVSLETALSEYSIISQMTVGRITVMTTGRTQTYSTPYGTIEFIHTKRSDSDIIENTRKVDGRPLRLATPQTAYEDLKRVNRNIHMVDMDTYLETLNENKFAG